MIKLKHINISIVFIVIVSLLWYYSFVYHRTQETIVETKYYNIQLVDSKECNEFNTKFRYHIIYSDVNTGQCGADYIWQNENIPWDSINAKKYQLVKYTRVSNTLFFDPITFTFKKFSKQIYVPKIDKKIIHK